jgi:hypothetical protein
MYKLKNQHRTAILSNDDHILAIAKRFNKKFVTVQDWFRLSKQNQLTKLEMLDTISTLLKIHISELVEPESNTATMVNNRKSVAPTV